MYYLLELYVKPRVKRLPWEKIDIAVGKNWLMLELLNGYDDAQVIVRHSTQEDAVRVAVSEIHKYSLNGQLSLESALFNVRNITLEYDTKITLNEYDVLYHDPIRLGASIQRVSRHHHIDDDLSIDQTKDLYITHPNGLDPSQCLWSVHGHIHRSDARDHGVVVFDGAQSTVDTTIGYYDFSKVGRVHLLNMLPARKHWNGTQLILTYDTPIFDQTPFRYTFLVFAGVIHLYDSAYKIISPRSMIIYTDKLNLFDLYYQSKDYVDLSSIPITEGLEEDVLIPSDFLSNSNIEKWLELETTFFVQIETDHLAIDYKPVFLTTYPNQYEVLDHEYDHTRYTHPESSYEPIYPLQFKHGLWAEYLKKNDHGIWTLMTSDNRIPNYVYKTTDYHRFDRVHPMLVATQPFSRSSAKLVKISSMKWE